MNTTLPSPRARQIWASVRVEHRTTVVAGSVLALASLFAAVLIYRKGLGTTFYYDEWNFVMNRRGWDVDTFLRPHNEHLSLVPVFIFKLLFATVGLDSYGVYRLLLIVAHVLVVALLFVLVQRRLGSWLAVAAAVLVLFLGAAWNDLLVPFQLSFVISVAAGLGALLALDRRDALGDVLACVLVAVGLASSSVGIPFAAAVVVETVVGPRRYRGLWIALVPLALYGLWSLKYGNPTATSGGLTLEELIRLNAPSVPGYAATAVSGAVGAVIGIGVDWGRPLVVAGVAVLVYRAVRGPLTPRLLGLVAAGAAFWGLTALFRAQLNAPLDSRYLYMGGVLVVLIAAELARQIRVTRRLGVVLAVLVGAAALANFGALRSGSTYLQDWSRHVQVELAALELAGPLTDPTYAPDPVRAPDITAGKYFDAIAQYGSPAASADEIPRRAETERAAADGVLVGALRPTLGPRGRPGSGPRPIVEAGVATASGSCAVVKNGGSAPLDVRLPPVGITVSGSAPLEVRLRGFADAFPDAAFGTVPPRTTWALRMPARKGVTWHVRLSGGGSVRACGLERSR